MLYRTLEIIKTIAYNEPNIGSVIVGDVTKLNTENIQYPAVVVSQQTHNYNHTNDTERFGLVLFCVDRLLSDESNRTMSQDWANNLIISILKELEEQDYMVDYSNIEPFTKKFAALTAGAFCKFNLSVDADECDRKYELVRSVNGMHGDVYLPSIPIGDLSLLKTKNKANIVDAINEVYDMVLAVTPIKDYLYFEGIDGSEITVTHNFTNFDTLEYSLNGHEFFSFTNGLEIVGKKIYFRGERTESDKRWFKVTEGNFNVGGNIMSLLFKDDFEDKFEIPFPQAFSNIFRSNNGLINANDLKLPATTLSEKCYEYMFVYDYNLVTVPELPATTLVKDCYDSMFYECRSLKTAPLLHSTELAYGCYSRMLGRTAIEIAPALPATTLAERCYFQMFTVCKNLITGPELPAITLAKDAYRGMFYLDDNLKELKCMARYNEDGTEITDYIAEGWLPSSFIVRPLPFYKNPDWAGPTVRNSNTIPYRFEILDWVV